MKNQIKFYLIGIFALTIFSAQGQSYIGAKTSYQSSSADFSGIGTTNNFNINYINSYSLGLFFHTNIGSQFYFRPEINYTKKGFDGIISTNLKIYGEADLPIGVGVKTDLRYIETPLNIGYSVQLGVAKLNVYAGPVFGYAANASAVPYANAIIHINLPRQNINLDNKNYNRWEIGANLGFNLAFPIPSGEIILDGRYNKSFTNFFKDPVIDINLTHKSLAFGIGYMYRI